MYFLHFIFGLILSIKTGHCLKLESYNIVPDSISVSGLSSGAAFATQFHVAFSNQVSGVGLFAGVPYLCAYQLGSYLSCMEAPSLVNTNLLIAETEGLALAGSIDATENLRKSKVFLYHGSQDEVVNPGILEKIQEFYGYFTTNGEIQSVSNVSSTHCIPTLNYGTPCGVLNSELYLENCNWQIISTMFNLFYGESKMVVNKYSGKLVEFDQGEFFLNLPALCGMSKSGYLYVPPQCEDKQHPCRLNIHFHGCGMSPEEVGTAFIENSGILEAADEHDTIVLFPQVHAIVSNPYGCWNWFGYLPQDFIDFYTKFGVQMAGVHNMMKRVADL